MFGSPPGATQRAPVSTASDRRFDAVLIAVTGTAGAAIALVEDGGRLTAITLDAPESVRGITTNNLYVQPDGRALGELAALAAADELHMTVQVTPVEDGAAIADRVAAGRSGGVKHVLQLQGHLPIDGT